MKPIVILQSFQKIILCAFLLFLGGMLDILGRPSQIQVATVIYYLILAAVFIGRVSDGIADRKVRRLLTAIAWMILLFFVFRDLKYYVFRKNDQMGRMLWYLYYVPVILLPTLSLFAAFSVDEGETKYLSKMKRGIGILSGVLLVSVLTNDLHQMVFRFQPGFQKWDAEYEHCILYFLVAGWVILLFGGSVVVMVQKCRVSASRSLFWIPLIPIFLGILYVILYAEGAAPSYQGINMIEFPEMACIVVACFWESCISIGLIPSNKGYGELFSQSGIAVQITDAEGKVMYRSKTALALTERQKGATGPVWINENIQLNRMPIHGGFVYWQNDVSRLNALNAELSELEERLSEEAELIRLQNENEEKRTRIEEQNRVYDKIAEGVRTQSKKIASCADLGWVCVYGAYVKRYSNLALLAENHATLPAAELGLAISETLQALFELGISVAKREEGDAVLPSAQILAAYQRFEELLEAFGQSLKGVYVALTEKYCKFVFESTERDLPDGILIDEGATWEDSILYVKYDFDGGKEQ